MTDNSSGPASSPEAPIAPRAFDDTAGNMERVMNDLRARVVRVLDQSRYVQQLDREILAATENAGPVLQSIVNEVPSRLSVDHVNIILKKDGKLTVVQSSDPRCVGIELVPEKSLCGQVLRANEDMHVPDVGEYEPDKYHRFHAQTRSEILLRIRDQDGYVLGVLTMERSRAERFDQEEFYFAQVLAGQIAIALQHSKLMASVERLHHLTLDLLVGRAAPETAYQRILEATLEMLECPYGQVLLRVNDQLLLIASSQPADVGLVVGPTESVCSYYLLAENGSEPLMINDIHNSPYAPYYLKFYIDGEPAQMQSEMILPIIDNDNDKVIGCINLESPDIAAFSKFHSRVVGTAGTMIQRSLASSLALAASTGNVEGAQRALEQLGYVANSLLHTFNNALVHALDGLNLTLELEELQSLRTSDRGRPTAAQVLDEVVESLEEARAMVADLRTRFNPDHPSLLVSKRDLLRDVDAEVNAFRIRRGDRSGIAITREVAIPERRMISRAGVSCRASSELLSVFQNLIDNAADAILERKHSEPNLAGKIDLLLDLPNPFTIRIRVRDNGSGVPADTTEKIFDYRFTTKSTIAEDRGVGLWFCQHYLQSLGGRIELNPAYQGGSEFVVTIPTLLS